jgi:hypothetical protein
MTTPDPVTDPIPVDVTNSVTLEPFPDSRVQTIAAIGVVLALLAALALIAIAMLTRASIPGEFWPVIGTLAGAPLLLLQRR